MLPHTGLFLLWKVALQIRIRRRLKNGGQISDGLEDVTEFIWSGSRLVQEVYGNGRYTYIHTDQDSYEPLAQIHSYTDTDSESRQEINYFHCDQIGIPREMTDRDGNLIWFGEYDAWGKLTKETNVTGTTHQPFRLQNQYCDSEIRLHYNFFRYYDPDVGRFVNQDPIGLLGGFNFYHFGYNTLNWVDFLGLRGVYYFTDMTQSYIGKGPFSRMKRSIRYRTKKRHNQPNPMSPPTACVHVKLKSDKMALMVEARLMAIHDAKMNTSFMNKILSNGVKLYADKNTTDSGSFLHTDALNHIEKHLDRFPLIKLDRILDWTPIEQYLAGRKTRYVRDNGGRPAYPLLSMFKAILLGQWHSLSDPELEYSLITRIDFQLFCRFDDFRIPDHSTLCRFRNWLAQDNTLAELLDLINRQLTEQGLKVEKASAAIVDATIIQTAGGKQRQAIEVDDEGRGSSQTTPSKDKDARWIKKDGRFHLGYKQHTRTDADGYIEKLHITPANAHECKHLLPLLADIAEGSTVYADKGYDSQENRQHLAACGLKDGIMQKAHRGCPLSQEQKIRNGRLAKVRYVAEQSFGTLHRKFRYGRSAYFGLGKVRAQSHLKAMCVNLLKAANRIGVSVAA